MLAFPGLRRLHQYAAPLSSPPPPIELFPSLPALLADPRLAGSSAGRPVSLSLQRAVYNQDLHGADMSIANLTADHYILQWPKRLQDGTFSRQVGWPNETSTETGSFVW